METEMLGIELDNNEVLDAYIDMWELISDAERNKAIDLAVRLRRADEIIKTIWKL